MHEGKTAPPHRPHNVMTLQMRQVDSEILNGWCDHSVRDYIEGVAFAGLFAGVIVRKAVEISYANAVSAIHNLTSRD